MTADGNRDRATALQEAIRIKRVLAASRRERLPARPNGAPARLGDLQRSLWAQHRMDPASSAYNLVSAYRGSGDIDVERLQQALDGVVRRHRILRSTYRGSGTGVTQRIHEQVAIPVETAVTSGDLLEAATAAAAVPFDLLEGPLVRMHLLCAAEGNDWVLMLTLHHILADEQSLELIWDEMTRLYDGAVLTGEAPQFDDYVHWSRAREGGDRDASWEFWRRTLDPPPGDLTLPFERSSEGKGAARGRLIGPLHGDAPVDVERIARVARGAQATPFAVYAFVYRLLLGRYTGDAEVGFATPVAVRSHPACADMVGYFLNPVVLRAGIDTSRPVAEALGDYAAATREALSHAEIPFEQLVRECGGARKSDRHPLFQTMLVLRQRPTVRRLGDAELEPVSLDLGAAKFDLTLFVTETDGAPELSVEYRADRFAATWMRRLLRHYDVLLRHVVAAPDRRVGDLDMLTDADATLVREAGEGAPLHLTDERFLPARIAARVDDAAGDAAVVCGDDRWTYAELGRRRDELARRLRRAGVARGDRVAVFLPRSADMIAVLVAIHHVGAAYVPLDPEYPAARNREVLESAEPAAVLTTTDAAAAVPEGPWEVVAVDRHAAGPAEPANGHEEVALVPLSGDDTAYILFTSGTTGGPKGVRVTHENLRASTEARVQYYGAAPERFLLLSSIAFDSSVAGIFATLAAGGALVVPTDDEARDARRLAQMVADQRVTALLCVPSLWQQMLRFGAGHLTGLGTAIVAGEACPSNLVGEHFRAVPGTRLCNEYGPTEATVWAAVHECEERDAGRPVPIGRPIPGVRIAVRDPQGRAVPPGVPGEAWISGRTVAAGYWGRDDASAERFVEATGEGEARSYRTGDLMTWTRDGLLRFGGRVDEQVKVRGVRIEPGEIEAVLLTAPAVREAVVVARGLDGAESASHELVAFVCGNDLSEPALRAQVAERLPPTMVPRRHIVMPELPRQPNGKVDRAALTRVPLPQRVRDTAEPEPQSELERALTALWRGLLGVDEIAPDDNLFELGGHSLLVVEMADAIERDYGVVLPAAEVFQAPTVRQLAARVATRTADAAPPYDHLYPIQPGGAGTPLVVAIPHFFTEMLATRYRGERPVYGLRGVGVRRRGNRGRWRTMRELAEELAGEIRRRFGDEPVLMAGYSFGASMAFETVAVMEELGIPVRRLWLIAPMPLDVFRVGPLSVQLSGLDRPLQELSAGQRARHLAADLQPFGRELYRRGRRALLVQPWRRLLCAIGGARRRLGRDLTPALIHADIRVERFRLHRDYRPGVIDTPTVFFNAREPETDAAATWRPHFSGPLEVVEIPDPHRDGAAVDGARRVILQSLAAGDTVE